MLAMRAREEPRFSMATRACAKERGLALYHRTSATTEVTENKRRILHNEDAVSSVFPPRPLW